MRAYLAWEEDEEPSKYFVLAPGPRAAAEKMASAILDQQHSGTIVVRTLQSGFRIDSGMLACRRYWVTMENKVLSVDEQE